MRLIRNQKIEINNKMNDSLDRETSIILTGLENGANTKLEIIDFNLFSGTAITESGSHILLEPNTHAEISNIIMKELSTEKVSNLNSFESLGVVLIDPKSKEVLYTDTEEIDFGVIKYRKNDFIDNYVAAQIEDGVFLQNADGVYTNYEKVSSLNIRNFDDYKIKEENNVLILEGYGDRPIGEILKIEVNEDYSSMSILAENKGNKTIYEVENLGNNFIENHGHFSVWEPGMIMSEQEFILSTMVEMTEHERFTCPNVHFLVEGKNILENVSISDDTVIGTSKGIEVSANVSNLKLIDDELYLKSGRKEYHIVSMDKNFVLESGLTTKDEIFSASNNLNLKLDSMTIENYDIVRLTKFNNDSQKFEPTHIFKAEGLEFELDSKSVLSLKNNFLQHEDKMYILKNPINPVLDSDIEISTTKGILSNGKVQLDGKNVKPDIILEEHGVMFRKGKIHSIETEISGIIGEDPAKPKTENLVYVSKKIDDIANGILHNLDLNEEKSKQVNNWNVERVGPIIMLSGETETGRVYAQLTELNKTYPVAVISDGKTSMEVELGKPSETISSSSVYNYSTKDILNQVSYSDFANDCNTKIYDFSSHVEASRNVRALPRECFASIDDELYVKIGDKLMGSDKLLDYEKVKFDIDYAFTTTPNDTKIIREMIEENVHLERNGDTITLNGKESIDIIPTSIHEGDRYASTEAEVMRLTEFPAMEM